MNSHEQRQYMSKNFVLVRVVRGKKFFKKVLVPPTFNQTASDKIARKDGPSSTH
jgi:hypothetical protein